MQFYGPASAGPFFVAAFRENRGARQRMSGGCPERGEPDAHLRSCSPVLQVQQRRPPPSAGTGRSCWGSGRQDARPAQGSQQTLGTATRRKLSGGPASAGPFFVLGALFGGAPSSVSSLRFLDSFPRPGEAFGGTCKVCNCPSPFLPLSRQKQKAPPFGGAGIAVAMTERVQQQTPPRRRTGEAFVMRSWALRVPGG